MNSFASSTLNEEGASTSDKGVPSTFNNGGSVANNTASNVATISIPSILDSPTEAINRPGDKEALDISILAEAILGPYTRSRAYMHQRAFRTGIGRELRQIEMKLAESVTKYQERHKAIHEWMREARCVGNTRHLWPPALLTAWREECESELADARLELRDTSAYIDSLRPKRAALKKLLWRNVLVKEGQLEALRLLLVLAEWEPAVKELRLLREEVERA